MKNILYIIVIAGLLTACKQDTPFPPGLDANLRFKKITSYRYLYLPLVRQWKNTISSFYC